MYEKFGDHKRIFHYYPIRTLDSIGSAIVSPNSNNYIIGNYKEPLCTTWMAKYILDN